MSHPRGLPESCLPFKDMPDGEWTEWKKCEKHPGYVSYCCRRCLGRSFVVSPIPFVDLGL